MPRLRQLLLFLSLIAAFLAVTPLCATSIVIFRGPHGSKIVVAADSEFSMDSSKPVESCKIVQIQHNYWTAISGLVSQPATHFDSFQTALAASSQHAGDLDGITTEVGEKIMAELPGALKHQKKEIGNEAFWHAYKDGFDAYEEAFWGEEHGVLRLIYLQVTIHHGMFGRLRLSAAIHACPGDACADPRSGFAIFLGHHKVIDQFMAENPDGPKKTSLENLSRYFVKMEIDGEPDCHCAAPISVLSLKPGMDASWVGEKSMSCQEPR